jgi:conjugative relaxase-like TrwC/TraI family protein
MVGLVVRKSTRGLLGYFGGDFTSRIWMEEGETPLLHPLVGTLQRGASSVPWDRLKPEDFRATVREVDSKRGKGEILGLELGFSPPKSISVAGLADEQVSQKIIEKHCSAVDDALCFLSAQLVARAKGELIDCGVRLFQFPHPWNRGKEPQLHSHIVLLRDYTFSHALWTTVVFLLQRSLREVYHYSLASRLLVDDIALRLGGSLAWELTGIPDGILERFSERSRALRELAARSSRGYFSQGAEFRIAGWASRRQLPPNDHSRSLAEARKEWRQRMPAFDLLGPSLRVETAPLDLEEVFRRSSVLTKEQFVACHLGRWIGARVSVTDAMSMAARYLDRWVQSGHLLRCGGVFCLHPLLATEGRILSLVTDGFDRAESLSVRRKTPDSSQMRKLLATRHAVKVVSTGGGEPPLPSDLQDSKGQQFQGIVETLPHWDSMKIPKLIQKWQSQPIVIFVEEPACVGDLGDRLSRLLLTGQEAVAKVGAPFMICNRRVLVRRDERTRSDAKDPSICQTAVTGFLGLDSQPLDQSCVTLLPGENADRIRELNWNHLERQKDGQDMVIYRRVPWKRLFDGACENLGLFAFRKTVLQVDHGVGILRTIRGGSAWFFEGAITDGRVRVRAKRQSKLLSLHALERAVGAGHEDLALIEPVRVRLQPGTPLASPTRFEAKGEVFRPGEVHIVKSVDPSGTLRFLSGLHWPNPCLVMEPVSFVRGFSKTQPRLTVIRVNAPRGGDRVAWLEQLPPADLTLIDCAEPGEFCSNLDRDCRHRGRAVRIAATDRLIKGEWMGNLAPLFPAPERWNELAYAAKPGEPGAPSFDLGAMPDAPPLAQSIPATDPNQRLAPIREPQQLESFPQKVAAKTGGITPRKHGIPKQPQTPDIKIT